MKKSVYIVVISVFVCVANFFFFSKLYINAVSEMNVKPHVLIGSLKNTDTIKQLLQENSKNQIYYRRDNGDLELVDQQQLFALKNFAHVSDYMYAQTNNQRQTSITFFIGYLGGGLDPVSCINIFLSRFFFSSSFFIFQMI